MTDCMHTYDWPGGNAASEMYKDVMPTVLWSAHNVSCKTKIYAGATYYGFVYAYLTVASITKDAITSAELIGTSTNCLFKGTSGYVEKWAEPSSQWSSTSNKDKYEALDLVSGSNQLLWQRDKVKICGSYEDATLNISMSFNFVGSLGISVNMKTDTTKPAPIALMDITIASDSTFNLNKSDYLFMPGSKLEVEQNATVNIGSGKEPVDVTALTYEKLNGIEFTHNNINNNNPWPEKNDALIINNGTINVNGKIGGKIISTSEGAVLNIVNDDGTLSDYKFYNKVSDPYYVRGTSQAIGNINGNENDNFSKNSYTSSLVDGEIVWMLSTNVSEFTINFYDGNTKLDTKVIHVVGSTEYKILGTEYSTTKLHYDFVEWLLANGNQAKNYILSENENSINLYASWNEHKYIIDYYFSSGTNDDGTINYLDEIDVTFESKLEEFTISNFIDNKLIISTQASYNNMAFAGWYIGVDKRINKTFTSITLEQFEQYLTQYPNINLMLYGEFIESPANIRFRTDYSDVATPISGTIMSPKGLQQQITLTDLDELSYQNTNNNNKFEYYFVGWYINGSDIVYNPNETIKIDIDDDIEFIAKWKKKITISFGEAPLGYTYTDSSNIYLTPHSDFNLVGLGDVNNIQTSDKAQLTKVTLKHYVISTDPLNQYPITATITDITESFTLTPIVQSDNYYRITYTGDVNHILERPGGTFIYDNIDYIAEKVQLVFMVSGKEGGWLGLGKKRTTITISGGCSVSAHGAYSDEPSIIDFGEVTLTGEITVTAKYGS